MHASDSVSPSGGSPSQEPRMRRFTLLSAVVEHPVRFALLALALTFVSCQDERSITDARHAPRLAGSVQTATVVIRPKADAFLNIDATSHGSSAVLSVYTWPDNKIAKDRKSTRLNSSHSQISYAVFCLKIKT